MLATLDNGVMVWVIPLSALLVFDGWIISKGHVSLSEHAGKHPIVTTGLLMYLGSHLLGNLFIPEPIRKYDPLGRIAQLLKKGLI